MALVLNDLAIVLDELHDVRKMWYEIGLRLQVSVEDLETISSEHKSDQHSLRRVVLLWLKSRNATWSVLCNALNNRTVGEMSLADKLRKRYICQEMLKTSDIRDELEHSRKLSSDQPHEKTSGVDCLDMSIIDVGSPSSEQFGSVDKTNAKTKKRSLDESLAQPEAKRSKKLKMPDGFTQDDFAKTQPTDRQCGKCHRIPLYPLRNDCCKALYCKPCSRSNKTCAKHEEEVEFVHDKGLYNRVQKLTVKCPNRENGCVWRGVVRKLKSHLPECKAISLNEATTTSTTEDDTGHEMTEDEDFLSPTCDENLPSSRVTTSDHIDLTLVSDSANETEKKMVATPLLDQVKMGSEFNKDGIEEGGEISEIGNTANTNCLAPPLNLIMKPISKYQTSTDEIWISPSFLSHQLGYKLSLTVRLLQQASMKQLRNSVQLEVGIVSAQRRQDSFLKFPCIGDIKVKILNPHQNKGHMEISMGFMINNDRRKDRTPELSYPMTVPKDFIFKDRLFFHIVTVQLSEDHRPWLLDPSQVTEDTAYSSDSESECNVVY